MMISENLLFSEGQTQAKVNDGVNNYWVKKNETKIEFEDEDGNLLFVISGEVPLTKFLCNQFLFCWVQAFSAGCNHGSLTTKNRIKEALGINS